MPPNELGLLDRFAIFEQLNLHQRFIDKGWGEPQAAAYGDLYWPEAKFNVNDLRAVTFAGPSGMKQMFDYAHSVFPMDKWFHAMGTFEISGSADRAEAHWRWVVSWKADRVGTVSTGTCQHRLQMQFRRHPNLDPASARVTGHR